MKSLRQTCAVVILSMALAVSAFAGTISLSRLCTATAAAERNIDLNVQHYDNHNPYHR